MLLLSAPASAQKRMVVKDPDLKFSYILPKGFTAQDTDYYHLVRHSEGTATLSLTYFEGRCLDLYDCYLGEVEALRHTHGAAFAMQGNGSTEINGAQALWFHYELTPHDAAPRAIHTWLFIAKGQYFKIELTSSPEKYPSALPPFNALMQSLRIR
jgi:hypothetical protein